MKLSIVIPALNEEASIEKTLMALDSRVKTGCEIIVVDDHSTDNTAQIVGDLSAKRKNIRLVKNNQGPGFANALMAGFRSVGTDVVVPVMADLCDEPETIDAMFEKISEGFDVVCGSRYMPSGKKIGGPKIQSFFSRLVCHAVFLVTRVPTRDISNSFKMYRKNVLDRVSDIKGKGFEASMEMCMRAYRLGFKITEVPTTWIARKEGESKFRVFKLIFRYAGSIWRAIASRAK